MHKRQSHGCFTWSHVCRKNCRLCMCRIWSIIRAQHVTHFCKQSWKTLFTLSELESLCTRTAQTWIHSGRILDTHVWMWQSPVQLNQHETESWSSASQREIPLDSKPSSRNPGIMFDSHFKLLMSHVGTATKSAFQSSETNWCMPSYPAVTHLKMYVKLGFRAESDLSRCHVNDSKSFYLFWSTSWSRYL